MATNNRCLKLATFIFQDAFSFEMYYMYFKNQCKNFQFRAGVPWTDAQLQPTNAAAAPGEVVFAVVVVVLFVVVVLVVVVVVVVVPPCLPAPLFRQTQSSKHWHFLRNRLFISSS